MKKNWIWGGLVLGAAALGLAVIELGEQSVYYYTPEEAFEKGQNWKSEKIRIGGMVEAGSVVWIPKDLSLNFAITDLKDHRILVSYKGVPPDMFKEQSGVIVQGMWNHEKKTIVSDLLMVKHSEEYRPPEVPGSDRELVEKAIFKEP